MVDQRDGHLGVPLGKPLEEAAVQEFAAKFRGELIRPGDDGYGGSDPAGSCQSSGTK